MILYPAIDLKQGSVVRLRRGDIEDATVFNRNPAEQARQFAAAGAAWLHLVDLDGAFAGRPMNRDAVLAILGAVGIPCQLGGGIRDAATLDGWIEAGIARIVLGTAALKDPTLVRWACRRHPGRIAIGVDAREGRVAVEGWAETSDITALDLALRFVDAGAAAIIFTDVDRDGLLGGANIAATTALAAALPIPVIASGGVSAIEELVALQAAGVAGAILGRALYDGRIDLAEALARCARGSEAVLPC
jgi:phosphoribosylformimino-5-aminoimidazole carboxamide ribotide isomerase